MIDDPDMPYERLLRTLPPIYSAASLSDFADDGKVMAALKGWPDRVATDCTGLYIWSRSPGTGKTHLAAALGLAIAKAGYRVKWLWMPAHLDALRAEYDRGDGRRTNNYVIGANPDVLVIDDLGANRTTPWANEVVLMMVEGAVSHRTVLIITSNLAPSALDEALGDRTASRIVGATEVLDMNGRPDMRRKKVRRR